MDQQAALLRALGTDGAVAYKRHADGDIDAYFVSYLTPPFTIISFSAVVSPETGEVAEYRLDKATRHGAMLPLGVEPIP